VELEPETLVPSIFQAYVNVPEPLLSLPLMEAVAVKVTDEPLQTLCAEEVTDTDNVWHFAGLTQNVIRNNAMPAKSGKNRGDNDISLNILPI
jgi:hypothetical protein